MKTSTTWLHSPRSASTNVSAGCAAASAIDAGGDRRSSDTTWSPRASSALTIAIPSQPEAPVTRIFRDMLRLSSFIRRRGGDDQEYQCLGPRAVQLVHYT